MFIWIYNILISLLGEEEQVIIFYNHSFYFHHFPPLILKFTDLCVGGGGYILAQLNIMAHSQIVQK